jgi:membrane-associated protease RseP (regulator of RpoE activity)
MNLEKSRKTLLIQSGLFILTVLTTTMAGAEWISGKFLLFGEDKLSWSHFFMGFEYSIPFLLILTCHEFGHYFTARYYKIQTTLPYYIPFWMGFIAGPSIGTMGAFIRIKSLIKTRKQYFDVGIAGPLAGFVVALGVLYYGYTNLPPQEYIFQIHPEYEQYGLDYPDFVYQDLEVDFQLGTNLLILLFEKYVATHPERIPNASEMWHYPWLLAGFLALLFTALNLIPIGQLDGGHILYGLIGIKAHRMVSPIIFYIFLIYAGLGLINPFQPTEELIFNLPLYFLFLFFTVGKANKTNKDRIMVALGIIAIQFLISYLYPTWEGYQGWLLFGFILGRFLGVYHPPALYDQPLDLKRKVLGWISLLIFVLCFSPKPIVIIGTGI